MFISRNEIKENAIKFAQAWHDARYERGEAQTFWNEFFAVFGIKRRNVAIFEERVKNLIGHTKFIDLFWPGKMLAEHKSRGADLGKAASQAYRYVGNLLSEGRGDETPRYIIVSDFARLVLHDLEPDAGETEILEFPLRDLHKHINAFGFILGRKVHQPKPEDPANVRASELMGYVHDALFANGYAGHNLERFLVRILFCLFAEDTGIFEPDAFTAFIEQTRDDGSDLGPRLAQFFDVLDTPLEKRQQNLDESLASLQYVNGGLFEETLRPPTCNRKIRDALLAATRFDWSKISPAIFGSLFQCVMNQDARRVCGAHYTAEENILKLIRPLFIDDLRSEFTKIKTDKNKLRTFHKKLSTLTFFDPACGCGNFLVLAYRELRRLEMDVFAALHQTRQKVFDASFVSQVDVDQFYGIEIVEFPVRIAETALWLVDHQMNLEATERFGEYYVRLPLQKSAKIMHGNSLRLDWNDVLPKEKCSFILGNPPYVGKHFRSVEQRDDMKIVFKDFRNTGDIDYVSCWYVLAAAYIFGTEIRGGFVSTSSITQGEQVEILWSHLFSQGVQIHFAYRTFVWTSEARGKAHVHCVIIGFSNLDLPNKKIFDSLSPNNLQWHSIPAQKISPYLIADSDVLVKKRLSPLGKVPPIRCGNKPSDGGHFLFTSEEKREFLKQEPNAAAYFQRYVGSREYINGEIRWCLWLENISPAELRRLPLVMERVKRVQEFRARSTAAPTRQSAETPTRFFYQSQPATDYILIPETSSERRKYIPMGLVSKKVIASNAAWVLPSQDLYLLGVLTSAMHMTWMRTVGGRLESRYRYSGSLIYNTFPWTEPTDVQKEKIKTSAQKVLDIRKQYAGNTLADLYDPLSMPADLLKAHRELDRAVDKAYRQAPFASDDERLVFLFSLYEKLTAPPSLLPPEKTRRKTAKKISPPK